MRLRTAASATAVKLEGSVAMGVAMAFAVSWKPFVKSKKSASADDQHDCECEEFHGLPRVGGTTRTGPRAGARSGGGSHVGADSPVDRHSLRVHLIVNRMSLDR